MAADSTWVQWADIVALVVIVGHVVLELVGIHDAVLDEGTHAVITLYIVGRVGQGVARRKNGEVPEHE